MRVSALIFILLTPSIAHAATAQIGLKCEISARGNVEEWRISADMNRGLYTLRIGNDVFRRNQTFTVDVDFGPTLQPIPKATKFAVQLTPQRYWLVLRPDSKSAWFTSLNGSNPVPLGTCADGKFEGL
jgi:hypothetical protein